MIECVLIYTISCHSGKVVREPPGTQWMVWQLHCSQPYPPPPFGKTRRNSQEESTAAAVAAGGWVCGENTCSTSVEDTTAAAGAVGGWVCGETNGNTSKVERGGLYYDADQDQNKRRRVSSFPTNQYVPPSFIERQRKRLSLAHVTTHPQSPTTVSMADRRRQMPSSTYQRGVQW